MKREYDVVVIGAGPAGTAAAIESSRIGAHTLLVERSRFPRQKVCGGCLGPRALGCLEYLGVDPLQLPGAVALGHVRVGIAGSAARLHLHEGIAVDRAELDLALLHRATAVGVEVVTETRARVGAAAAGRRAIQLAGADAETEVTGRVVLDATGLPAVTGPVTAEARVGLGQSRRSSAGPAAGEVWMLSSAPGYVGMVRFADDTLNVAASVRADALADAAAPGVLIDRILEAAGVAPLGWTSGWRGTRPLRRAQLDTPAERLLPIGDAGGFWEPFTGEGIGWALESGVAVAAPARALAADWSTENAQAWVVARRAWMRRVQARSRIVAGLAARPGLARVALGALRHAGPLARWALPASRPRLAVGAASAERGQA